LGLAPRHHDESIFIVAHRDGWFEGAVDNGSGVATMLGLAEYFAKIPKEQRKRTIYFLGTSGHHDNNAMTGHWLAEHKELFAKTALLINCEHTTAEQLVYRGGTIRRTNTTAPLRWYVGGSPRLQEIAVKAYATFGVPTYAEPEPAAGARIGPYYQLAPALQLIEGNLVYWHSDLESADFVPPTGLAASTRAFAKIITEVNQVALKDLQRPLAERRGSNRRARAVSALIGLRRRGSDAAAGIASGSRRREDRQSAGCPAALFAADRRRGPHPGRRLPRRRAPEDERDDGLDDVVSVPPAVGKPAEGNVFRPEGFETAAGVMQHEMLRALRGGIFAVRPNEAVHAFRVACQAPRV